jgi:hypothetical protein
VGPAVPGRINPKNINHFRELQMSSTFDTVANIISETCDIPREKITPSTI